MFSLSSFFLAAFYHLTQYHLDASSPPCSPPNRESFTARLRQLQASNGEDIVMLQCVYAVYVYLCVYSFNGSVGEKDHVREGDKCVRVARG